MQNRKKGPGPTSTLSEYYAEITPRMKITRTQSDEKEQSRTESPTKRTETEAIDYVESPEIKRKLFPKIKNGYNTGFTSSSLPNSELHPILKRIEDKVFIGTKKAFTIYKSFDVDNDGMVIF